ncbi:MAG: flagellar motor switch protein FliN [Oxalobacter formigenes]|nr:flagellar motor switch protein FliN [Oxalobacter formigenes]MCM1281489.1 flagellar motor switch protein FliN [Alistipes senegalensis]MCM1513052.1 flagellar motor switch protein FliN [Oxalobacter formigenes]
MSETTDKPEAGSAADDWSAALAEEAAAKEAAAEEDKAADDMAAWGAALAEQAESEAMAQAESAVAKDAPAASAEQSVQAGGETGKPPRDIDFILDIPIQMTVELGRTKLPIKNLLQLAQGSVVELDGLAGEPMDVLVNGCLIAQGEVVVVNDKFGIRLTDVITPAERIRKLNR